MKYIITVYANTSQRRILEIEVDESISKYDVITVLGKYYVVLMIVELKDSKSLECKEVNLFDIV